MYPVGSLPLENPNTALKAYNIYLALYRKSLLTLA